VAESSKANEDGEKATLPRQSLPAGPPRRKRSRAGDMPTMFNDTLKGGRRCHDIVNVSEKRSGRVKLRGWVSTNPVEARIAYPDGDPAS